MTPDALKDFFLASSGVAGALVGLLFVAMSIAPGRRRADEQAAVHRVRASATLTAFTNALAVSLFALVPGHKIGWAAFAVAIIGLLFVAASVLSLIRARALHWRDAAFLLGLAAVFVVQLLEGVVVLRHPAAAGTVNTLAILVIVCFFVGIARAWELIGEPEIRITSEVRALLATKKDAATGGVTAPDE